MERGLGDSTNQLGRSMPVFTGQSLGMYAVGTTYSYIECTPTGSRICSTLLCWDLTDDLRWWYFCPSCPIREGQLGILNGFPYSVDTHVARFSTKPGGSSRSVGNDRVPSPTDTSSSPQGNRISKVNISTDADLAYRRYLRRNLRW